jgi:hypothetical protein
MGVFNHMHLTIGEVSLLIQDTMPHVETYPDQDEDEPDTWRPAGHPHAQGRAVDILGPDGSITHLTGK